MDKVIARQVLNTLTPQQTAEILRQYGMSTTPETIRERIKNGQYPFGVYNGNECTILVKKFKEWLAENIEIEIVVSNGMSDWKPGGEQA